MKHTKLCLALLAAAAGSAGCGHCDRTEVIAVSTFTTAAGQAITNCSDAGVSTLRYLVDGVVAGGQDFPCPDFVDGAALPVSGGQHQIQIQAFDASGTFLYASNDNLNVNRCGTTIDDSNLTQVADTLSLTLAVTPTFNQCPQNSLVWYSLTDLTTNEVITVNGLANSASAPRCSGTVSLGVQPFGPYRLDAVEVVTPTGLAGSFVPFATACTPQTFTHAANDTATVNLTASSTSCSGF